MAQERIDSLISEQALKEFDQLVQKSDAAVASFEKLIAKAVDINRALGGASTKSIAETNEQLKKMAENEAQISGLTKQLIDLQQKLSSATSQQNQALNDSVKVSNEFKNRLTDLRNEQKKLADQYKDGKISLDEYKSSLVRIAKEEGQVKNAAQQLNGVIRTQIKEQQAAEGSVEQLKARLTILQKTFDNLSRSQRNSSIGREVQKDILRVNDELSKLEQSTGRFQRNVGNYKSAVQGIGAALGPLSAAIIGLGSISEFFTGAFEESEKAEQAISRFKNTLEGVGRLESFERLNDEATRLAETFGFFGNDDILEVFDQLTTYGKLTEKQITELTPVIIDFAAKSKLQFPEATKLIIGALEGQGKALKQYGIDIKEGQNVTERLGIVMTDLKGRVEGTAQAFGQTLKGQVEIANERIKDLQGQIGDGLNPLWTKVKLVALEAFAGIIQGAQQLSGVISDFFDNIFSRGESGEDLTGGLTTSLSRTSSATKKEAEAYERLKKNAREYANTFVQSIGGNVDELERQLQVQREILKTDLAALQAGDKSKVRATANSTAIVKALQTEIRLRKERNTLADKTDTKPGSGKSSSAFFFDQELKDQAAAAKKLSEVDSIYLSLRLNARKLAAELEQKVLEGNREKDITNAKGDGERLKEISIRYAYEQKKIAESLAGDLVKIRQSANQRIIEADKGINEQFAEEAKLSQEKEFTDLVQANERRINEIAEARDEELRFIEIGYQQKLIAANGNQKKIEEAEKEFADKRKAAELNYAAEVLSEQIRFTEAYIALAKLRGEDTAQAEEKLANLKLQYARLVTEGVQKENDKQRKSEEDKVAQIEKNYAKIQDIYSKAEEIIGGFIDARVTREKNAIQDTIDLNNERTKQEIESVNASALSEQEKANRISIINARNQAQKESLERRQRQLDLQRARFEKAAGLGQIIINTARGVTAALTSLPPNVPLAIQVGAIGALQFAVAASQPLPRFAKGTDDAPGGPVVVGDGGRRELVVTPSGELIPTPAVPTVMNVPRHSLILPDLRQVLEASIHPRWGGSQMRDNEIDISLLGEKLDRLNTTIKNKQEIHIHPSRDGWKKILNRDGVWTEYLNRNI